MADLARPRPDCPESEELWDAVSGHLPVQRTREIVDHTASCPGCAETWLLARQLHQSALRMHPRRMHAARHGWRWAAAAAVVIVAGLVAAQLWMSEPKGDSVGGYRDPGTETIRSLLVDGEAVPRERFRLRWIAETERARRFHVRVATEDLQVIAQAHGLEEPEYLVPEDALDQILTGERVLWQVEVTLEDGSSAVSQTFVNRLE